MAVLGVAILLLPVPFPSTDVNIKTALLLCLVFSLKLWDAWVSPGRWAESSLKEWLVFLANPLALVHRRHAELRPPKLTRNLKNLVRGAIEVCAGAALFRWADAQDLGARSFWLEHVVRLAAGYLFLFDGGCVTLVAVWRLLGLRCVDFSVHPILARTPAEFWRRYNRWMGQFLFEDVFRPLGGIRRPLVGIGVVFAFMGVFHEYLAWLLTGRVTGYLLAYFAIHAAAVAATHRLRPKGAAAVLGIAGTLLFQVLTSVLFFADFHRIGGEWYSHGSILP